MGDVVDLEKIRKDVKAPGRFLVTDKGNSYTKLNFTSSLNEVEKWWTGGLLSLADKGFNIINVSRKLDVVPTPENPLYQQTVAQKAQFEERIKPALVGIEGMVKESELVGHDLRRLREMTGYIRDAEKGNDLPLKNMFVTQVDYYVGIATQTGMGSQSMDYLRINNFMPTIVDDFKDMDEKKIEKVKDVKKDYLDKDARFKNLPTVEKNLLAAKWASYTSWKKDFKKLINERYKKLKGIELSRRTSLKEYREWLKPTLARHKLLTEKLGEEAGRKEAVEDWLRSEKRITSTESIRVLIYAGILPDEPRRPTAEVLARHPVDAYDDWLQKNILYGKKEWLEKYPWATKEWIEKLIKDEKLKDKVDEQLYWAVFDVKFDRTNLTLAGTPIENGVVEITTHVVSKNILLALLIENEARKQEFESYVTRIVGVAPAGGIIKYKKEKGKWVVEEQETSHGEAVHEGEFDSEQDMKDEYGPDYTYVEEKKEAGKKLVQSMRDVSDYLGVSFALVKGRGPYEKDFKDAVIRLYVLPAGGKYRDVKKAFVDGMKVGG